MASSGNYRGDGDDTKIKTADGTEVGGISDSFKIVPAAIYSQNVIDIPSYLVDGSSSPSMKVDGSVTPVEFTWSPPPGEDWYVTGIDLILADSKVKGDKFGDISQLTNGLLTELKTQGTTYTLSNCKTTLDLALLFRSGIGSSSTTSNKLLDTDQKLYTATYFTRPIKLSASSSDFVKITVRDDLTGLDNLRASVKKFKVI